MEARVCRRVRGMQAQTNAVSLQTPDPRLLGIRDTDTRAAFLHLIAACSGGGVWPIHKQRLLIQLIAGQRTTTRAQTHRTHGGPCIESAGPGSVPGPGLTALTESSCAMLQRKAFSVIACRWLLTTTYSRGTYHSRRYEKKIIYERSPGYIFPFVLVQFVLQMVGSWARYI